jgi:predicted ATPase
MIVPPTCDKLVETTLCCAGRWRLCWPATAIREVAWRRSIGHIIPLRLKSASELVIASATVDKLVETFAKGHPVFLIDQPEDDLDNETIFRHVVEPLLRVKARSQFIIATHNPNIPVLGDAELVHVNWLVTRRRAVGREWRRSECLG